MMRYVRAIRTLGLFGQLKPSSNIVDSGVFIQVSICICVSFSAITYLISQSDYCTVRDTIGTGIYFMTYESAKQLLANSRGDSPTTPGAVVVAGGLCGVVSWACVSDDVLTYMNGKTLIVLADLPD